MSTEIVVNGATARVRSDPDTPLLTVLRDELGLLGSRFGCGLGQCGACFVRLGDAVVASCDTPLWQAAGAEVTTVEGLSGPGGTPHPVQQAILDRQAAQCGFCISGVVVRAAALLDEVPEPDEAAVCAALERNLCRCGVQRRIVDAVVAAGATPMAEERAQPTTPVVEERAQPTSPAVEERAQPTSPVVEERAQPTSPAVEERAQRASRDHQPAAGHP